jgi:hypothetical protein
MLPRQSILKIVTTLSLSLAIAGSGLEATASCASGDRADQRSSCQRSTSCCCGKSAQPRTCACKRQQDAPPQPVSLPDGNGPTFKSLSWIASALAAFAIDERMDAHLLPQVGARSASTSRSIQEWLCIWRI